MFSWQLFQNKITSKDYLLKRGIFSGDATLCVSGCDECGNVTTYYLNTIFSTVWWRIYLWLVVRTTMSNEAQKHFEQFANVLGGSNSFDQNMGKR